MADPTIIIQPPVNTVVVVNTGADTGALADLDERVDDLETEEGGDSAAIAAETARAEAAEAALGTLIGSPASIKYHHSQSVPADTWSIPHNLGYKPGGIYAENSAHDEIVGRITHVDNNNLTIQWFSAGLPVAESGEAYLS